MTLWIRKRLQESPESGSGRNWRRSVEFWLKNGMDQEHGGVYTCLDRTGQPVLHGQERVDAGAVRLDLRLSVPPSTASGRSGWRPARAAWTSWRSTASTGRRAAGCTSPSPATASRCASAATASPRASTPWPTRSITRVTGDRECLERARRAYELIWQLNNGLIKDPTGMGPKTIPETRTGRALADPMIYLNITSVMRRLRPGAPGALYDARAKQCVDDDLPLSPQAGAEVHPGERGHERRVPGLTYTAGPRRQPRPRHRVHAGS